MVAACWSIVASGAPGGATNYLQNFEVDLDGGTFTALCEPVATH
jgi:hypothetical protein